MNPKRIPRTLTAILVLHLLIAAVGGGLYLLNQTPRFKELADPGLPPPQPPPARQTVGPAITIPAPPRPSSDSYLVSANVLRKPRRVASGNRVPSPLTLYLCNFEALPPIDWWAPPANPPGNNLPRIGRAAHHYHSSRCSRCVGIVHAGGVGIEWTHCRAREACERRHD